MSPSKVVFVTGVSSGIGRATALQFSQRGCRVFGSVRNTSKAEAIPGVEFVEMDVRDDASVKRAIDFIIAKSQRIDVLVNSAGLWVEGRLLPNGPSLSHVCFPSRTVRPLRGLDGRRMGATRRPLLGDPLGTGGYGPC